MSHWFLQWCSKWNWPPSIICLQTISLIEKWYYPPIIPWHLLNSVLLHTGVTLWSYMGVCAPDDCRTGQALCEPLEVLQAPQFLTPLFCINRTVLVLLCSPRTEVVFCIRWHKGRPTIVADLIMALDEKSPNLLQIIQRGHEYLH